MKKFFKIISVYLAAMFLLSALIACSYAHPTTLPKLAAPVVTIDGDGVASWNGVENAIYYIYVIDEGEEKLTDECSVKLSHDESIKVKAMSGSEKYADSDFSQYKTYIKNFDNDQDDNGAVKLGTPEVTINGNGVATWGAIADAQYYVYVVNGGAETRTTVRTVTLVNNQTLKVKACSDDEDYKDSDYSPLKTYVNGSVQTKLGTPQVTINGSGVATWGAIADAQYYVYVVNGGAETRTTERTVTLVNNQTFKVKACSDDEDYKDSDYSPLKTYAGVVVQPTKLGTPQVAINSSGVATWGVISNAQYYVYVVNGGTETRTTGRTVTLTDNQTLKVKACSDDDGYTDSDYSQLKTYVSGGNQSQPDRPLSPSVQAYYSDITATGGNTLLGQVHDLITTTHTKYTSYTDCKTPSKVIETDKGVASKTVMDFYTQEDMSSSWGGGKIGTWNREHVWCQSLSGGMWGQSGGGSDMHHIRPTESGLNSTRGNHKFGNANGGSPAYYKDTNGSKKYVGGYVSGDTFEPLDKVKGDVARIVMYVYTHYNTYANVHGTTNGKGDYFGTLRYTYVVTAGSEQAAIALLLEWHEADPVDDIEIARNEAVYNIQGNRNPFIDHPEYATAIWG